MDEVGAAAGGIALVLIMSADNDAVFFFLLVIGLEVLSVVVDVVVMTEEGIVVCLLEPVETPALVLDPAVVSTRAFFSF